MHRIAPPPILQTGGCSGRSGAGSVTTFRRREVYIAIFAPAGGTWTDGFFGVNRASAVHFPAGLKRDGSEVRGLKTQCR